MSGYQLVSAAASLYVCVVRPSLLQKLSILNIPLFNTKMHAQPPAKSDLPLPAIVSNPPFDGPQISLGGASKRGLRVAANGAVRERAVDPVEAPGAERIHDAAHRRSREWNVIGIAVHEAEPARVHADLRLIARKQDASTLGA